MKTIVPAAMSRSWRNWSRADSMCLAAFALVIVTWVLLPVIPQDQSYHRFADQRSWLGVAHAADVLSNVAFALVGVVGIAFLASDRRPTS